MREGIAFIVNSWSEDPWRKNVCSMISLAIAGDHGYEKFAHVSISMRYYNVKRVYREPVR